MAEVTWRTRFPHRTKRHSEWLPSGLLRSEAAPGFEDMTPEALAEWYYWRLRSHDYATWRRYTLVGDDVLDTHQKIVHYVEKAGELRVNEEAEAAVEEGRAEASVAEALVARLQDVLGDECFQNDWRYLRRQYRDVFWRGRFYPDVPRAEALSAWKELTGFRMPSWERHDRMWEDVNEFLACYEIDAVCAGVPFVDLFDVAYSTRPDGSGRYLIRIALGLDTPVRKVRRVVEAALAQEVAVRRMVDRGAGVGRGWYYQRRNERIYDAVRGRRFGGAKAAEAYEDVGQLMHIAPDTVKKVYLRERRFRQGRQTEPVTQGWSRHPMDVLVE